MSSWTNQFKKRPKAFSAVVSVALVAVIGVVDYLTGYWIFFSAFYLLPVGLATWFVGGAFGVVISMLGVAVSLAGDYAAGAHYPSLLVPIWNSGIALAVYFVVVKTLTSLRRLQNELEERVRLRTAALTNEMQERARLEKEVLEISEREQRRIGHDLHDSLGQHLTGTALAAQVLEEKLTTRGQPEAADANKVVELVEEGILLSRKLAQGLHPFEMEPDGLMRALEELVATSSELFKVSCRFECDSPVLVHDGATSAHLYRIAQEAVSNAVKHGKAKNVVVQLEAVDDGMALRVRDDGIGLPDSLPEKRGLGLRIMAHRASIIGATFAARREDSGGTIVACLLRHKDDSEKGPRE
jgi:signal transduction histidine kinase